MSEFKNYDKAIIVSGDGDFHCLVEYLERKNKLHRILVSNKPHSGLLCRFNNYISRNDLLKESKTYAQIKNLNCHPDRFEKLTTSLTKKVSPKA